MEDILARMQIEEAELLRKLAAVRSFFEAYGGRGSASVAVTPAMTTAKRVSVPSPQRSKERTDKFGSYGASVIESVLLFLNDSAGPPTMTRELVATLEGCGVSVRGENKVNALSALLARSSRIKGHGKSGWTLATEKIETGAAVPAEIGTLNGNAASVPPPSISGVSALDLLPSTPNHPH